MKFSTSCKQTTKWTLAQFYRLSQVVTPVLSTQVHLAIRTHTFVIKEAAAFDPSFLESTNNYKWMWVGIPISTHIARKNY